MSHASYHLAVVVFQQPTKPFTAAHGPVMPLAEVGDQHEHHFALGTKPDREGDVVLHQPTPSPHLSGEKVRHHQHLHMRVDELLLCRRLLEDIAYGLVADGIT